MFNGILMRSVCDVDKSIKLKYYAMQNDVFFLWKKCDSLIERDNFRTDSGAMRLYWIWISVFLGWQLRRIIFLLSYS